VCPGAVIDSQSAALAGRVHVSGFDTGGGNAATALNTDDLQWFVARVLELELPFLPGIRADFAEIAYDLFEGDPGSVLGYRRLRLFLRCFGGLCGHCRFRFRRRFSDLCRLLLHGRRLRCGRLFMTADLEYQKRRGKQKHKENTGQRPLRSGGNRPYRCTFLDHTANSQKEILL